jgi:DNA topoisomerase-3
MTHDFSLAFKSWHSCDPFDLFEADIEKQVAADKKTIEKNLIQEARRAQMLMIWTDCDREGENIGEEVASVCRKANRNITVRRARFSAIIAQCVTIGIPTLTTED